MSFDVERLVYRISYGPEDVDLCEVDDEGVDGFNAIQSSCTVIRGLGYIQGTRMRAFLCLCNCGREFIESEHRFGPPGFTTQVPYCGRCELKRSKYPREYRSWMFLRMRMVEEFRSNFDWFLEYLGRMPSTHHHWKLYRPDKKREYAPGNAAWRAGRDTFALHGEIYPDRDSLDAELKYERPEIIIRNKWMVEPEWVGPEV